MPDELVLLFRIDKLERRSTKRYVPGSGKGADAQFEPIDLGLFAVCGGVSFALGVEACSWRVGDLLELRKRRSA